MKEDNSRLTRSQLMDIFALNNKGYIFTSSYAVAMEKKLALSNLPAYSHVLLESFINQDPIKESYVNAIFQKHRDMDMTICVDDVILDDVSATTAFYQINNQQKNSQEKINIKTKTTVIVENSSVELNETLEKDFSVNEERYKFLKWFQQQHNEKISIIPPKHGTVGQMSIDYIVKILKIHPITENNQADSELAKKNKKKTTTDQDSAVRFQVIASNHNVANLLGVFGILSIHVPVSEIPQILKTGKTVINHPNIVGVSIFNHLKGNDSIYDIAISIINEAKNKGFRNSILEFQQTPYEFSISDRLEIAYLVSTYSTNKVFFPMDKLVAEYFDMPERHKLLERYATSQSLLINRIKSPMYTNEIAVSLKDVPFNIILSKDGDVYSERLTNLPTLFQTPTIEIPYKIKDIPDGAVLLVALDLPLAFDNFDKIINIGLLAKKLAKLGLKAKPWVKTIFNVRSFSLYNLLKDNGYLQALEKIGFTVSNIGSDILTNRPYLISRKIEKEIKAKNDIETVGVFSYGYNITRHYNDNVDFNIFVQPMFTLLFAIQGTANSNLLSNPITSKRFKKIYAHNLIPTEKEIIAEREIFEKNLKNANYNLESIHNHPRQKTHSDTLWDQINIDDQDDQALVYQHQEDSLYFKSSPKGQMISKINELRYNGLHILGIFGNNITTDQLMGNFQLSASKYLLQNNKTKSTDINFQRSYNNNDRVLSENLFNSKFLQNSLFKKNNYGEYILLHEDTTYVKLHEKLINSPTFHGNVIFGGTHFGIYNNANNVAYSLTLFNIRVVVAISFDTVFRRDLILNGILPVRIKYQEMANNMSLYGYTNVDIILVNDDKILKANHKCIITNNQKSNNNVSVNGIIAIQTEKELQAYLKHNTSII